MCADRLHKARGGLITLYNRTSWTTQHALSSDHVPIITTINLPHDYRLQQTRQTFTNYKKADWTQFTEDIEFDFALTTIPTNILFTNMILIADKHNIPKGKMHNNCMLLPYQIVCKITQRNNIKKGNTCDPPQPTLNTSIQQQNSNHTQTHCKLFHQTIYKHATHRYTSRATHKIPSPQCRSKRQLNKVLTRS